jgi:hypothetical protein
VPEPVYIVTYPTPEGLISEPAGAVGEAIGRMIDRSRQHGEARVEVGGRTYARHFAARNESRSGLGEVGTGLAGTCFPGAYLRGKALRGSEAPARSIS